MRSHNETERTERRRRGILWLGGFAAAFVMALGVSGTLASWTTAIIHNTDNSVGAVKEVVALAEAGGSETCETLSAADNTVKCAQINKYGGKALVPGDKVTTKVEMKNVGTVPGKLSIKADMCHDEGGVFTPAGAICKYLHLEVTCGANAVYSGPLASFEDEGEIVIDGLNAGAGVGCAFTVALDSTAPPNVAGMKATQVLTWTLQA